MNVVMKFRAKRGIYIKSMLVVFFVAPVTLALLLSDTLFQKPIALALLFVPFLFNRLDLFRHLLQN